MIESAVHTDQVDRKLLRFVHDLLIHRNISADTILKRAPEPPVTLFA